MQLRYLAALAVAAVALSCVPGGAVYLGPSYATVEGHVYSIEDRIAVPQAEVCVLGSDTSCVRSNDGGEYTVHWTREEIVSIRFRIPGARPAVVSDVVLVPPEVLLIDCVMSTRMTLSTSPGSCRNRLREGDGESTPM